MTGSSGALLINLSVAVGLLVGFLLLSRVTRSWRWSPDRLVCVPSTAPGRRWPPDS